MLLFVCRYCEECEAAFLLQSERTRTRTRTRVKEEVVSVEIQLLEQTSGLNAYQMALTINFLLCIFRRRVLQHAVEVLSLSLSLLQMMILLITRTHSSIKRTAASIALFCIKPKRIHAREQLMMMMMLLASEGGVAAAAVVLVVVAVVAFAC